MLACYMCSNGSDDKFDTAFPHPKPKKVQPNISLNLVLSQHNYSPKSPVQSRRSYQCRHSIIVTRVDMFDSCTNTKRRMGNPLNMYHKVMNVIKTNRSTIRSKLYTVISAAGSSVFFVISQRARRISAYFQSHGRSSNWLTCKL